MEDDSGLNPSNDETPLSRKSGFPNRIMIVEDDYFMQDILLENCLSLKGVTRS